MDLDYKKKYLKYKAKYLQLKGGGWHRPPVGEETANHSLQDDEKLPEECPVCIQPKSLNTKLIPCWHHMCSDCYEMLNTTGHRICPICRTGIVGCFNIVNNMWIKNEEERQRRMEQEERQRRMEQEQRQLGEHHRRLLEREERHHREVQELRQRRMEQEQRQREVREENWRQHGIDPGEFERRHRESEEENLRIELQEYLVRRRQRGIVLPGFERVLRENDVERIREYVEYLRRSEEDALLPREEGLVRRTRAFSPPPGDNPPEWNI